MSRGLLFLTLTIAALSFRARGSDELALDDPDDVEAPSFDRGLREFQSIHEGPWLPPAIPKKLLQGQESQLDPTCTADHADPYDWGWRMPKATVGKNKGRCIEADHLRSSRMLSAAELATYADAQGRPLKTAPDEIALANFHYHDRWWIFRVKPDSVETSEPLLEPYAGHGPVSHVMIAFHMASGAGIVLTPQERGAAYEEVRMQDFVASAEPVHPVGTVDSRMRSFLNDMAITYNFQAMQDKYDVSILKLKRTLILFPLKATHDDTRAMLLDTIYTAHVSGNARMYNPAHRSCMTEPLRYVDRTLGHGIMYKLKELVLFVPDKFPRHLPKDLKWRHVLNPDEPAQSVDQAYFESNFAPPARTTFTDGRDSIEP